MVEVKEGKLMTKKEKIDIVRRYFGLTVKGAKGYVERETSEREYEEMKAFLKKQAVKSFYED